MSDPSSSSEFVCSRCNDYLVPPIRLCPRGHNICEYCSTHVEVCPFCNATIEHEFRNVLLETCFEDSEIACKNEGCRATIFGSGLVKHSELCEFKMRICPFKSTRHCTWQGSMWPFVSHMQKDHPEQLILNCGRLSIKFQRKLAQTFSYILSITEYFFLATFKKDANDSLYACVYKLNWLRKYKSTSNNYNIQINHGDTPSVCQEFNGTCPDLGWNETDEIDDERIKREFLSFGPVLYNPALNVREIWLNVHVILNLT